MSEMPVIQQANRVAMQFAALPREQAIAAIRAHIENFWESRDRDRLVRYAADCGEGLEELAVEAVKQMAIDA